MPNRGTDLETIEQALTRLDDMLVDRCTDTRADLRQAAIAPGDVVKTTRLQLHSPLQAAASLARLAGMGPNSGDLG